jgi:hypothetical protein
MSAGEKPTSQIVDLLGAAVVWADEVLLMAGDEVVVLLIVGDDVVLLLVPVSPF